MKEKNAKYITIKQALSKIKDGDYIVLGMAGSEPREFVSHIHEIASRINRVTLTNCLPITPAPFYVDPQYKEKFQLDGWFYNPSMRNAAIQGNISFIPNHLHLAGKKRFEFHRPDVFVGICSPVDQHGFVSLSLSNVYEKRAISLARVVILEENPNYPRVFGDVEVHISQIDYLIKTSYDAPILSKAEVTEKDQIIGSYIAKQIKDGSCIQLGIGGMPDAVADALITKKNLGLHTEMFTTGAMKLIKAGVINGSQKQLYPYKHVAAFALGTKELYEFIDNNPSCLMLDGNYVNDPAIIGLNDNQVSINAALEIDLSGQCASESIGYKQFSGTGGQSDTAVGAQNSKNGLSFIALYSTTLVKNPQTGEREEVSKIVPVLKPGAAVSLSRNDVDRVVTEYGIVNLRGTSIEERTKLLISIAHPKFRKELEEEAIKMGYLSSWK
ncbi:MAG: 4-hydroxybutyrate--acetyl-CoA CoA transferase [Acholeplasmatales bacterium]|jgi:acyl-CoA hydrolase|nr:4-hydroxybutyrate--acetyl-CoA CoA transferase [Acholeplasmatales bacterium]